MTEFIQQYAGSFAVGAVLLVIVAAIVVKMIRDKMAGKSSCGGDCSHCCGCGKHTDGRSSE